MSRNVAFRLLIHIGVRLRVIVVAIVFLLSSSPAIYAQVLKREKEEGEKRFLRRIRLSSAKDSFLRYYRIPTYGSSLQHALVAFYLINDNSGDDNDYPSVLAAYLLLPQKNGLGYRAILIDKYQPEGSSARPNIVFTYSRGPRKASILIISCAWPQHLVGVEGTLYETFAYENPREVSGNITDKLRPMPDLAKKLGIEFQGDNMGKKVIAKYKTEASIRRRLTSNIK